MRIIIIVIILLVGCGTVASNERFVTVGELSMIEWTEVSEECYLQMVQHVDVVGMRDGERFLLALVNREGEQ